MVAGFVCFACLARELICREDMIKKVGDPQERIGLELARDGFNANVGFYAQGKKRIMLHNCPSFTRPSMCCAEKPMVALSCQSLCYYCGFTYL